MQKFEKQKNLIKSLKFQKKKLIQISGFISTCLKLIMSRTLNFKSKNNKLYIFVPLT